MKDTKKVYWKGFEELANDPDVLKNVGNEFPEFLPVKEAYPSKEGEGEGAGRRDFLKLLGFGMAAVSLAACEAPVKRAIPYLNQPEEIQPGIANWYATTYVNGSDYCSVIVKTREGRPIKIEGNSLSNITNGGTSARAQASVLSLYDEDRLKNFVTKGKILAVRKDNSEYAGLDKEIISALEKAGSKGIRIVSRSVYSPTTLKVIEDFKKRFPGTSHIMYDPISLYGMRQANKASFGREIVPSYNFSNAEVIVGFNCDFLGSWISPVQIAKDYIKTRKVSENKKSMSRHYQFETNFSITGAKADYREPIKPSEEGLFLAALYSKVTGNKLSVPAARNSKVLNMVAEDLKAAKGKSLVVSGSNDANIQILVNEINQALDNYGATINLGRACNLKKGNDQQILQFVNEVKAGQVGGVIFMDANPVYDLPVGNELKTALNNVGVKISLSQKLDETSELCDYVCPGYHYLESWNDCEPYQGYFSTIQPTIAPIFPGTRQVEESLLIWAGQNTDYYTYLRNNWRQNILAKSSGFDEAWNTIIHNGVFEPKTQGADSPSQLVMEDAMVPDSSAQAQAMLVPNISSSGFSRSLSTPSFTSNIDTITGPISQASQTGGGMEVFVYESVAIGDGSMANNPWLQELADPLTKVTWDNFISISYADAKSLKLAQGQLVNLKVGKYNVTAPVAIQPGQAKNTVSLSVGYGRTKAGIAGNNIGVNAYPFLAIANNTFGYAVSKAELGVTTEFSQLATMQTQDTVMDRESVIQESTLTEFQSPEWIKPYNPIVHTANGPVPAGDPSTDLWYQHDKPNHLWGMVIDLNSCIGCGACVVACNVENNIPVVGKKEVMNRREMHWLRIDRYYTSDMTKESAERDGIGLLEMYDKMESPSENPEVVFQPMLCQHCNHAPCETVCPVAATTHSSEGLNQMAYNRCVGTRYCANNCPYKVRRFNWFKYFDNEQFDFNTSMNTTLGRMVLNPDVTVRSRGVMEKCTFCVQRIQEGKLAAKKEKRRPVDGEVVTACASSCPTNAIQFGDTNDSESKVYKQGTSENKRRAYTVLQEINTRPNILYLTHIRNKKA